MPATIEPRVIEDVSAIRFLGAEVAAKHPVVKTWQVPAPSTVDPAKRDPRPGPVRSARQLSFQSAYPVLQGYKESAAWATTSASTTRSRSSTSA